MKAIVYIDSRNFHYRLAKYNIVSACFDYRMLGKHLTRAPKSRDGRQTFEKELSSIKFYGAKYPASIDQNKHNHDDALFSHLETEQRLIIRLGTYFVVPEDRQTDPRYKQVRAREKGVDVLIATDLIVDAYHEKYDVAYIVSDDSDLIPAVLAAKKVRTGIKVIQVTFNKRENWAAAVDGQVQLFPQVVKRWQTSKVPVNKTMLNALEAKFNGHRATNQSK